MLMVDFSQSENKDSALRTFVAVIGCPIVSHVPAVNREEQLPVNWALGQANQPGPAS